MISWFPQKFETMNDDNRYSKLNGNSKGNEDKRFV